MGTRRRKKGRRSTMNASEKAREYQRQIDLNQRVVDAGILILNCPECGSVFLGDRKADHINCPYCGCNGEPSIFPDFIY